MSDEMFRLTAVDVRRKEFVTKLRGYDAREVDDYLQQVAAELERLMRSNQELDSKVKASQEQLIAFRERDKALNDALVSAQQLRSEVREQSEREAQIVMREARTDAERIVQAARLDAMRIVDQITALAKMRRGYLTQFRVMLERQLAEIAAEEDQPDPDTTPITGGRDGPPSGGPSSPNDSGGAGGPRSGAMFRG
jgi:DivIVA domain-containing protein